MAGGRSDAAARGPKQFVDFQNDVAASDILLAAREGFESVEHVKRYTAMGFGTDQGKLGNINGMAILAQALGKSIPETGTTTYRPNYTPVSFGAFAGRELGEFLDPVRKTCLHEWHAGRGALFEDVGNWKRPWYYPRRGEDLHAAVRRECLAVRNGVGILDASTLGKIDIQGPDAVALLNWMYTNPWGKLEIGKCRYGLMLDENGMVFDDGVTTRLGEHHFMMTTTTGGAARVLSWMERWLQTEWPQLKVRLASVTDHWATFAVAGPKSRAVLRKVCGDIDFSNEAFPFMSYRDGLAAGVPARVMRISFSGERAYEVNVPANAGRAVWEALMAAGEEFGITPYGTETMHVLRAEKGYIIVGQDTDGSVTPQDLGMGGLVAKTKDCLGKRSLARSDTAKPGRKQFVGLLTEDAQRVLPEGAQIVERDLRVTPGEPTPMIGHVTSSYYSPILRRSIALALVRGGLDRMGERVEVSLADGRGAIAVIASPVFYDAQGSDSMRSETDMVAAAGTARLMLESPLVGVADLLRAQEGASTRFALRERAFLDLVNVRASPPTLPSSRPSPPWRACACQPNPIPWRAANVTTRYGWGRTNGCCVRSSRRRPAGCMRACPRPWPAPTRRRWTWAAATRCWKSAARRRAALARGCPLDLHPRVFKTGQCAQSHFQDGDRARTHGRRAHGSGRAPQLRRLFLSHPARRRGALARMNSLRDAPRDVLDDADARPGRAAGPCSSTATPWRPGSASIRMSIWRPSPS